MPFISSSELCSRIKALYRKTWYLNNPFLSQYNSKLIRIYRDAPLNLNISLPYFSPPHLNQTVCVAASRWQIQESVYSCSRSCPWPCCLFLACGRSRYTVSVTASRANSILNRWYIHTLNNNILRWYYYFQCSTVYLFPQFKFNFNKTGEFVWTVEIVIV